MNADEILSMNKWTFTQTHTHSAWKLKWKKKTFTATFGQHNNIKHAGKNLTNGFILSKKYLCIWRFKKGCWFKKHPWSQTKIRSEVVITVWRLIVSKAQSVLRVLRVCESLRTACMMQISSPEYYARTVHVLPNFCNHAGRKPGSGHRFTVENETANVWGGYERASTLV